MTQIVELASPGFFSKHHVLKLESFMQKFKSVTDMFVNLFELLIKLLLRILLSSALSRLINVSDKYLALMQMKVKCLEEVLH